MFCMNCGFQNDDGANFCQQCRSRLNDGAAPAAPGPAWPNMQYNAVNNGRDVLKRMAGSGLFVTICSLMSAQVLFALFAAFGATSKLTGLINQYMWILSMSEYGDIIRPIVRVITSGSLFIAILPQIPAMVTLGGLWAIFAAGKNRNPQSMGTVGLTITQVMAVLSMIGDILVCLFTEGALILSTVIVFGDRYVGGGTKGLYIGACIGGLVGVLLRMLYDVKILKMLSAAKRIVFTGVAEKIGSVYVAVLCFLSALSLPIMGVLSGFLGFLGGLCGGVAMVCIGVCIFNIRSRMNTCIMNGGSMPAMAAPAPAPAAVSAAPVQVDYSSFSAPAPAPSNVSLPTDGLYKPDTTVLSNYTNDTTVLSQSPVAAYNQPAQPRAALLRQKDGSRVEIVGQLFRIGKGVGMVDYFIGDNSAVSRHHADILYHDGSYFIRDNNSTNHVYVNEQLLPANQEVPLENGCQILLADDGYLFSLEG